MSRLIKKQEVNDTDFGHVIVSVQASLTGEKNERREQSMWCWVRVYFGSDPISTANRSIGVVPDSLAFPCATQKVCSKGLCVPA